MADKYVLNEGMNKWSFMDNSKQMWCFMKMNISVGNNVKQSQKSLFYNMDVKLRRNINSSVSVKELWESTLNTLKEI